MHRFCTQLSLLTALFMHMFIFHFDGGSSPKRLQEHCVSLWGGGGGAVLVYVCGRGI